METLSLSWTVQSEFISTKRWATRELGGLDNPDARVVVVTDGAPRSFAETGSGKALDCAMDNRASPDIPPSGMSRLRQACRVQRDRYAAGTETGLRRNPLLKLCISEPRLLRWGRHAGEHHLTVAVDRGRNKE